MVAPVGSQNRASWKLCRNLCRKASKATDSFDKVSDKGTITDFWDKLYLVSGFLGAATARDLNQAIQFRCDLRRSLVPVSIVGADADAEFDFVHSLLAR